MMGQKYVDFDAMWAEKGQEGDKVTIMGDTMVMPSSLPAKMVIRLMRYKDKEMPAEEVFDMVTLLYGQEHVDKWMDKGLTIDQFTDLVQFAVDRLNPAGDKEEEAPLEVKKDAE